MTGFKVGDKIRVKFWQTCLGDGPSEDEATVEIKECWESAKQLTVYWPKAEVYWWVSTDVNYTRKASGQGSINYGHVICRNVKRFE